MSTYHKINGIYKRDERGKFIEGDWACEEFGYLADLPWRFTEKVDGTNIRLTFDGTDAFRGNEHLYVQGRTNNAQVPPKLLAACVEILRAAPLETAFPDIMEDPDSSNTVVLYGEGYGAGIQKGGVYRPDPSFVLFDVRVGRWWLKREAVNDIGAQLGLDVVAEVFKTFNLNMAIMAIKSQATGGAEHLKSAWDGAPPEGVVGTPAIDLFARSGERIITKIKLKDFQ
jgi:hypothetical protein